MSGFDESRLSAQVLLTDEPAAFQHPLLGVADDDGVILVAVPLLHLERRVALEQDKGVIGDPPGKGGAKCLLNPQGGAGAVEVLGFHVLENVGHRQLQVLDGQL